MASGDMDALQRLAQSGDPSALTALGKRLLVGEGLQAAPGTGADLLRKAASNGHAEAAAQLAICAAWGVAQTRNIEEALDHLEQAAGLGWLPAQRELQLLARNSGSDWSALRGRIAVATWTTPPAARIVSERPRVIVIEGFMSAAECDWLIERGRPSLRRAMVYRDSAKPRTADTRTNSEAPFTLFNADIVLNLIRERMSSATRAPTTFFEVAKLLHYEPGQQFALHADFLQINTPELLREVAARGQRAATFLVYLNDDFEGGETDFPRIPFRFKGGRGDALLFSNIDPAGAPDYDTVHAGLPPTRGEKWLLSQWIRTRAVGA
ncbi:MAG: 2OG-Fe(II) oxygenase [Steroidobacter sp.]